MADFKGYEIIGEFSCGDKCMVVIRVTKGTHIMPSDEWEQMKKCLGWEQTPPGLRCFRKESCNVA